MSPDRRPGAVHGDAPVPWRVVVGTDGSPASLSAVRLAADEAWSRAMPLHVVVVAVAVGADVLDLSAVVRHRHDAVRDARAAVDAAIAVARARRPGVNVTGAALPAADDVAADQTTRTRDELTGCALLVVGPRGRRGMPAFGLGTTSALLVRASTCPVMVAAAVHEPASPPPGSGSESGTAPVVACVDLNRPLPVLVAAAQEAAARSARLVVLHVADELEDVDGVRNRLLELARSVAPEGVEVKVVAGPVVPRLLEAALSATVLVVGSRGTLALAGLALGSVSHEVLRAVQVPVLVARAIPDQAPVRTRERAGAG